MSELIKLEQVLDQKVRPVLRRHSGDVQLESYNNGIVSVKLLGACAGCPSADFGTRAFIEDTLKTELQWVEQVELYTYVDPELLSLARRILGREVSL